MNRRSFLSALAAVPAMGIALRKVPLNGLNEIAARQKLQSGYASMWIYLWDFVDEGYDNVLARLRDHGLTAVSMATAYHAGRFLAPHNPKRKVVFLEDGTVYFKPRVHLYGKVQPIVNSLVREGHGLERLKTHADRVGLGTHAWVVCCHNTPLGMRYPDIVCRTVFGDPLYHNLCPSNPDVRRYVRTLVRDIAERGVSAIELEALQFQGYSHGFHHEREGVTLPTVMRFLLGLCFCPSCVRRADDAGVAIESIRFFARERLEQHFVDPRPASTLPSAMGDLPQDLFGPFLEWRQSVILSFVDELKNDLGARDVRLLPLTSIDPGVREFVGVDAGGIARRAGGMLATAYVKDGPALRAALSPFLLEVPVSSLTLGFQVGLPESGGETEFLERLSVAREMGIARFNFYNYGFIPLENLQWIAAALRR